MKKFRPNLLLRCFFCSVAFVLLASQNVMAGSDFAFRHLNTSNSGLSDDCVWALLQDSRGYIWIGTRDGLNRYDGNKVRSFRNQELKTHSNFITSLCEDHSGNIWVGTDMGVTVYKFADDSFEEFNRTSVETQMSIHDGISTIVADDKGRIWLGVNNQGLFCYDPAEKLLHNYFYRNGEQLFHQNIHRIGFDRSGRCYLSIYFDNLYVADDQMTQLSPVAFSNDKAGFARDNVNSLICASDNTIYLTSENRGLCEIYLPTQTLRTLLPLDRDKFKPVGLSYAGRTGNLWIATVQGATVLNTNSGKVRHITIDNVDKFGLNSDAQRVMVDRNDRVWLGTSSSGVDFYDGAFDIFRRYDRVGDRPLGGTLVRYFAEDQRGNVWIATRDNGLLRYELSSGRLTEFVSPAIPRTLYCLCYNEGALWIGSVQGIHRLDLNSGRVKTYDRVNREIGLLDNRHFTIFITSEGTMIVGTTLGMLEYDPVRDAFAAIESLDGLFITDMAEDDTGQIWVATYAKGILRYNPSSRRVTTVYNCDETPRVPTNKINNIAIDRHGSVWASTNGFGPCLYDPEKDLFAATNLATDSFSSDVAYKMVEEGAEYLWLSSSNGLMCFSPQNGTVFSYAERDGILNNAFSPHAGICCSDGTIMFGSYGGFIRFDPRKLHADASPSKVVINDLLVNNKVVRPHDEEGILVRNIELTEKLVLPPDKNTFGFELAVLGKSVNNKSSVVCLLEGYDQEWQSAAADNLVNYFNVPAGLYTLRVNTMGVDGSLGEEHRPLQIVVSQHFYATPLALTIYFVVIILIVVASVYYFTERTLRRRKAEQAAYQNAREMELFNERVMFFAHVIHEIKTPITLIRTPLHNILGEHRYDESMADDLQAISRSADYLTDLVNELLDYVRTERRGYVLECTDLDLADMLRSLCMSFSDTAHCRNLRLDCNIEPEHLWVRADRRAIRKVLNNLLSNALKYADQSITVSAGIEGNNVVVVFANDGKPVPQEYRQEIFKPFKQYRDGERAYSGGVGIGLSLARNLTDMHGGTLTLSNNLAQTEFVLTLPHISVPQTELSPEEERPEHLSEHSDDSEEENNDRSTTILIVDDNNELAEYLKRKLQPSYTVITAADAERALVRLKESNVDLVLTDLSMPGIGGLELCHRIRADIEISHTPIVVLSARSSVESKIAAMEAGANIYLEKPFDMDYLRSCIHNILERRTLMRSAFRSSVVDYDLHAFELPKREEEMLIKLDKYVIDNISDSNLSCEELASHLNMSQSTFIRKIRKLLDTTPNNYIRTKRLAVAAQMLARGSDTISDVYYAVGFTNSSYFAKCFKEIYGMSPAEYMKKASGSVADNTK